MFVKICGITRREDAEAAVAEGAQALGFVFWPESPRFLEPSLAEVIAAMLPNSIARVGVFVNQPAPHVNAVASSVGLSAVQLHGDEDERVIDQIALPVIKAVSARNGASLDRRWPEPVMLLVDADDPIRRGGTGTEADWSMAADLARRRRVLLAGGLRPENVARAIEAVRPYGIDVSSGVEQSPGVKDRQLLAALFEAVRAAGRVVDTDTPPAGSRQPRMETRASRSDRTT